MPAPDNQDPNPDNLDPNNDPNPNPNPASTWRDSIDPTLKDNPSLAKFKDVGGLAKSYLEQEKLVGRDKLVMPKDEKDEKAWEQVYNKLGRPEDAKAYKLPEVELDPMMQSDFSPEMAEEFKGVAHKLGLTQRQVEGLYAWRAEGANNIAKQIREGNERSVKDTETAMRKELGAAWEERKNIAVRAAGAFAKSDAQKEFIKQFGNDPRFIGIMMNAGMSVSEDVLGPGTSKGLTMTPGEAQSEIDRIMSDANGPYFNSDSPEHDAMVKRVANLYRVVG